MAALLVLVLAGCSSNPPETNPPVNDPTAARTATPSSSPVAPTSATSATPATSGSSGSPVPRSPVTPPPPSSSAAAIFDPNRVHIDLKPFAQGLDNPVFVTGTADGSGRLFAVEQPGRIRVIGADGSVGPSPFLDISARVSYGGERGLLGLALHPDFAGNGRLFVDYTRQPDSATVISEFHAKGDAADPASEQVLLVILQPYANHNGGMLAFDSRGMLVIGMGDGGSGGDPHGNGQNRDELLAKLLRIDVNGSRPYAVPLDNPFLNVPKTRPEIWDLGVRNPWRFSFDRETGDLFIGDVGQGSWEEIDAEPAGAGGRNYGWNVMEATHCFQANCDPTGLTLPVAEYGHGSGCSVTGGYVYRGSLFPDLVGGYLFGDYCSGTIWALSAAVALANGTAASVTVGSAGFSVSSFGQGDDGELYVVDLGGRVLKVEAAPAS